MRARHSRFSLDQTFEADVWGDWTLVELLGMGGNGEVLASPEWARWRRGGLEGADAA